MNEKGQNVRRQSEFFVTLNLAREAATNVRVIASQFPAASFHTLTLPLVEESQAVASKLARAWSNRHSPTEFLDAVLITLNHVSETLTLISMAKREGYLAPERAEEFRTLYERISGDLARIAERPGIWIAAKEPKPQIGRWLSPPPVLTVELNVVPIARSNKDSDHL